MSRADREIDTLEAEATELRCEVLRLRNEVEALRGVVAERDIALFWLGRETYRAPVEAVKRFTNRRGWVRVPNPYDKPPEFYRALGREKAGLPAQSQGEGS